MKIEATIAKARALVREDKELSAATKSMFEILLLIITLLANRLNLNSTNSSKPPSSDPNRKKRLKKTGKKAGGQKGHVGTTVKQNDDWTFYGAHEKRGTIAMNDMGILPLFKGTLCHGHWKPYYTCDCTHALCNAHHFRELTRAREQDGQKWAKKMEKLLETINWNKTRSWPSILRTGPT